MAMTPHVPIVDGETLTSWVSRCVRRQLHCDLMTAAPLLMLAVIDLHVAGRGTLVKLSDLFGIQPGHLGMNAIMSKDGSLSYKGQEFDVSFLSKASMSYCPACLLEGGKDRMIRQMWLFQAVRVCPIHDLRLHEVKRRMSPRTPYLPDLAPVDTDLRDLVHAARSVRPTRLQTYVTDRIAGAAGPAWLDAQRMDEAFGSALQLGILERLGPAGSRARIDPQVMDEIEEAGFAIAADGEQAAIDRLQMTANESMSRPRIRMADPAHVFGSLHEWTFRSSQAGPIARLLDEVILKHLPCGTCARPGTKAMPPRLHTASTLAKASGMKKSDLVAILRFQGLIPEGCSHENHPFDRVQGEEVVRRMGAAIPAKSVASYLNCHPRLARDLMTNGLIQRLGRSGHDSAITGDGAVDLVEKSVLDTFLHSVFRHAETSPPDAEREGLLALERAAHHQDWPVTRIILMIQRGVIRTVYRRQDIPGLEGLFIDLPKDLWPVFSVPTSAENISFQDAIERFGEMGDMQDLLALANEDGSPMLKGAIDPYERRRNVRAFCAKSFNTFARRHVTSEILADTAGITSREMVDRLRNKGIEPILPALSYRPAVYRRDAV